VPVKGTITHYLKPGVSSRVVSEKDVGSAGAGEVAGRPDPEFGVSRTLPVMNCFHVVRRQPNPVVVNAEDPSVDEIPTAVAVEPDIVQSGAPLSPGKATSEFGSVLTQSRSAYWLSLDTVPISLNWGFPTKL